MDNRIVLDKEALAGEFISLVTPDSLSYKEREVTDLLKEKLLELGFIVTEDDAAAKIGGNAGNVYAFLPGDLPGDPILFTGHTDTVAPGTGKKAVRHPDGRITSDGSTILGADDFAGITEILGGIRAVIRAGIPRRDIEILFSPAEEVYTVGASVMDYSRVRAKEAYCLDLSGHIGTAAVQAPSLVSYSVTVKGKGAHAGFEPEKGIHAIAVAAEAIASLRQGHIDEETTLNIGTIEGGTQINAVPALCRVTGEARGFDHEKVLTAAESVRKAFEAAAEKVGAEIKYEQSVHLHTYRNGEDEPVVRHFRKACESLGIPSKLQVTFGGSDVNQYILHGIRGLVISSGMFGTHTTSEYCCEQDLYDGAQLVAELACMRTEEL